jgi:hypothetical protein
MPPDRNGGRASKACTACRKIKTRCYESDTKGRACLRCERLRLGCSLQDVAARRGSVVGNEGASSDDRLGRLERVVEALVERLDSGEVGGGGSGGGGGGRWERNLDREGGGVSTSPSQPPPIRPILEVSGLVEAGTPSAAPVFLIRDVASEVGVQREHHVKLVQGPDIVTRGMISVQDAGGLIGLYIPPYLVFKD